MELAFISTLETAEHGRGTYHLFTVPEHVSSVLSDLPVLKGGFQSIKCRATVGESSWNTSVFPSGEQYILLIAKKWVAAESLIIGEPIEVTLTIE